MGVERRFWMAAGCAAALLLTACDGGPSAVAARSHDGKDRGEATTTASADDRRSDSGRSDGGRAYGDRGDLPRDDPRKQPIPKVDGKPMWAANRRHTAQENAEYRFQRDGADFGAKDVDDYVSKAHAFVASPPRGAETLTRRNGDTLIYDPKGNVFAVVTKDGAPRTMFKPRNGAAYWDEQKDRVAKQDKSSRDGGDDRG